MLHARYDLLVLVLNLARLFTYLPRLAEVLDASEVSKGVLLETIHIAFPPYFEGRGEPTTNSQSYPTNLPKALKTHWRNLHPRNSA